MSDKCAIHFLFGMLINESPPLLKEAKGVQGEKAMAHCLTGTVNMFREVRKNEQFFYFYSIFLLFLFLIFNKAPL